MGDEPAGKGACNQARPEFDPQVSDSEREKEPAPSLDLWTPSMLCGTGTHNK